MKLGFHGAARQVTGSMFLIETSDDFRILVDCGLDFEKNKPPIPKGRLFEFEASMIQVVLLTHAHLDHSGNLPNLLKEGFEGKIICTHATYDLAKILLIDSANLNKKALDSFKKAQFKKHKKIKPLNPYGLYFEEEVKQTLDHFQTVDHDKRVKISDNIHAVFHTAGHLLGASHVELEIRENDQVKRMAFSGDVGRKNYPLLKDPVAIPEVDYLICESTYGNRLHKDLSDPEEVMLKIIQETCVEKAGRLIIPAFSIGRTQALLFVLNKLAEKRSLPPIKIYTDSPLAMQSTQIYDHYSSWLNDEARKFKKENESLFDFENLVYISRAEESRAISNYAEPCIIISSSGMIDGGRITQHVLANISNPYCTILIIGYCVEGSLGYDLLNGRTEVRNNGKKYEVKARIATTDVFSGHGDLNDLKGVVLQQEKEKIKNIFLVHGDFKAMENFKSDLNATGYDQVVIPQKSEIFEL